jgi:hypothetical protein
MGAKEKRKAGVIMAALALLCACASAQGAREKSAQDNGNAPVIETPERPRWISRIPESGEYLYFTGMAESDLEFEARNAAAKNGFAAAAGFYASLIQSETTDRSVFIEAMGRTIADATSYDDKTNSYTNAVISELTVVEYHLEILRTRDDRLSYKVWALCRVPRQKAEADRANFVKNISEGYTHMLDAPADTVAAAVHSYSGVLAALERNPLHRAAASYDGPAGAVNLYEYLLLRLNALAGSLSFAPLPAAAVEKTGVLDMTVRVLSPPDTPAGALDCAVSIYGTKLRLPRETYTVGADNSFPVKIAASRLEPGKYTVQLDLLLNEIDPRVRKNPSGIFSLEVTPLKAAVDFAVSGGGLGEMEKDALVQGIQQGIRRYGVPVTLSAGREAQSGAVFTVTLHFREQAPAPPLTLALIACDAEMTFSRNGQIWESALKHIVETSAAEAVRQARKFIEENEGFFRNLGEKLSQ